MGFAENLAALPAASPLQRIELLGPDGARETLENVAGSQGSLRVYQHLALRHGEIGPAAAAEGLLLYAEHGEDARRHPGKHPNIDRLLAILASGACWQARLVKAGDT